MTNATVSRRGFLGAVAAANPAFAAAQAVGVKPNDLPNLVIK